MIQKKITNIIREIGGQTCFGCGVCVSSCPQRIISLELNNDGFYIPNIIKEDQCVGCEICLDVCAFIHEKRALGHEEIKMKSWAAWSNDEVVRKKCSSGGIGFEIGKQLIMKGYHAVGCRYDTKEQRAEHYISTNITEFIQSIGSKYIQSYTGEAFSEIKRRGQKYLITGTPCQIDSFRRMIRRFHCEDNFILMDFFCHCVPSMHVWKLYIKMFEPVIGEVVYASWRNKFTYGWHDSWLMGIDGNKTSESINWDSNYNFLIQEKDCFIQSRLTKGDLFYKFFLGDVALGPQCQRQCKYKYDKSSADIRIGDLWGPTFSEDQKGTSALIAFTPKGKDIIEGLEGVTLVEYPFETVAEGQMKSNAKAKEVSPLIMFLLKKHTRINSILFKLLFFVQRVITKIKQFL